MAMGTVWAAGAWAPGAWQDGTWADATDAPPADPSMHAYHGTALYLVRGYYYALLIALLLPQGVR